MANNSSDALAINDDCQWQLVWCWSHRLLHCRPNLYPVLGMFVSVGNKAHYGTTDTDLDTTLYQWTRFIWSACTVTSTTEQWGILKVESCCLVMLNEARKFEHQIIFRIQNSPITCCSTQEMLLLCLYCPSLSTTERAYGDVWLCYARRLWHYSPFSMALRLLKCSIQAVL